MREGSNKSVSGWTRADAQSPHEPFLFVHVSSFKAVMNTSFHCISSNWTGGGGGGVANSLASASSLKDAHLHTRTRLCG